VEHFAVVDASRSFPENQPWSKADVDPARLIPQPFSVDPIPGL
jgi:hypothetical protein